MFGRQAVAKDLVHLSDIKILHGQDAEVAGELESMLGLGALLRDIITGWAMQGKGRALWCVGDQRYKLQVHPHPIETRA